MCVRHALSPATQEFLCFVPERGSNSTVAQSSRDHKWHQQCRPSTSSRKGWSPRTLRNVIHFCINNVVSPSAASPPKAEKKSNRNTLGNVNENFPKNRTPRSLGPLIHLQTLSKKPVFLRWQSVSLPAALGRRLSQWAGSNFCHKESRNNITHFLTFDVFGKKETFPPNYSCP